METRLSQKELARKIGVTQQYISFITNGKRTPSPGMAAQLEKATGIKREAWVWPAKYGNPYIQKNQAEKEGREDGKKQTQ